MSPGWAGGTGHGGLRVQCPGLPCPCPPAALPAGHFSHTASAQKAGLHHEPLRQQFPSPLAAPPRRRFRPPMQTLKRGLEGKGRAEAAAILEELGTFLLHFVTTKPWSGNKWEDQVYRGEPAGGAPGSARHQQQGCGGRRRTCWRRLPARHKTEP